MFGRRVPLNALFVIMLGKGMSFGQDTRPSVPQARFLPNNRKVLTDAMTERAART
jgi:hypothetical protein